MKTLSKFIKQLQKLEAEGHGDKRIFAGLSASGDCGSVNSAYVSSYIGECGPFYLNDGEEYINLCVGGN